MELEMYNTNKNKWKTTEANNLTIRYTVRTHYRFSTVSNINLIPDFIFLSSYLLCELREFFIL